LAVLEKAANRLVRRLQDIGYTVEIWTAAQKVSL